MTDATTENGRRVSVQGADLGLARRYAKERRLKRLGIAAITIGTVAWAVAWLVLTFGFPDAPQSWRAVSAAGFVLGLIGGVLLVLRHRRITRRHGQE